MRRGPSARAVAFWAAEEEEEEEEVVIVRPKRGRPSADPPKKVKKSKPIVYKVGDTVAVHAMKVDDEEVVFYVKIDGPRKSGKKNCFVYDGQYFDIFDLDDPNYGGCYKLVGEQGDISIDEDIIIDRVVWIENSPSCTCSAGPANCKYFLGDDQCDKMDKMLVDRVR